MDKKERAILYIDGENLRHYIKAVLKKHSRPRARVEQMNFQDLFSGPLAGIAVVEKRFYSARLREHIGSLDKSRSLIKNQRALKASLERQGFKFIISGNVRGQTISANGKKRVIFKEKGVDVRIAVDLMADACDQNVDTIVLCSSDSDLQPAIAEMKKRKIRVIYLGFEMIPNKGLMYTSDRTILLRNSEIVKAYEYAQKVGAHRQ